jgi:hypothetical protein
MGQPAYLRWKHRGDNSMLATQGASRGMADDGPARPASYGKSLIA